MYKIFQPLGATSEIVGEHYLTNDLVTLTDIFIAKLENQTTQTCTCKKLL